MGNQPSTEGEVAQETANFDDGTNANLASLHVKDMSYEALLATIAHPSVKASKTLRHDVAGIVDEALKDLDKFSKDIEMSVSQIASRSAEEAEAAASGVVVGAAAADVVEVIETAHEYTNNMDQDWECRIPGAERLTLHFDERSTSEQRYDYLRLYRQPNRVDQIGADLTGDPANWQERNDIEVEGDVVYFYFHSDGSNTRWGFRCEVTGHMPQVVSAPAIDAAPDDVAGEAVSAGSGAAPAFDVEGMALRAMLRSHIALMEAQAKTNPGFNDLVLGNFNELLRSAPPGGLARMSGALDAAMTEFQDYILGLLAGEGESNPAAASMAAALAIGRGSQQDLLKLLPLLYGPDAEALPLRPYLTNWYRQLKSQGPRAASALTMLPPSVISFADIKFKDEVPERLLGFATNGTFVWAKIASTLVRYGSGLNGTEAGKVYASGEVGEGEASILSFNGQLLLVANSQATFVDPMSCSPSEDGPLAFEVPEHPLITDGFRIYEVWTKSTSETVVTPFDFEPELGFLRGDSVTIPLGAVSEKAVCTNGREVLIGVEKGREEVTVARCSLHNGSVISKETLDAAENKVGRTFRSFYYDAANNLTWVTNDKCQAVAFANPGRLRPFAANDFAATTRSAALDEILGGDVEEDAPIAPNDSVRAIVALLDLQIAPWVGVRFRTADDEFKTREPFVFDLALDTMKALYAVMKHFFDSVTNTPTVEAAYSLYVCITMLDVNFTQLNTFGLSSLRYGMTPELSDKYRDVLYNLLEVADVAGGTPELNEAIARLRDAALHTLGSTGFKQFFPTSEQQTRVFSELVNQGDSLSEGKKKVLNQLVVHAAPSILASMSKAEDDSMDDAEVQASLASKLEFLSSLLMQVYANAATELRSLPKKASEYTPETIEGLRSSAGVPNGFLKLVRDGQNKLQAVDDPRLNEVKLGYAHQVLTLASRLFELMANPIEGLDEVSDSQKNDIATVVTDKFMEVFGELLVPILHALVLALTTPDAAKIVDTELLSSLIACLGQLESLAAVLPMPTGGNTVEKTEVVETPHPYTNNLDTEWILDFEGIPEVEVTFDPQCRTEDRYDKLTIIDGNGATTEHHGRTAWDPLTITVGGGRIVAKFHSDGSNVDWGVKATFTAKIKSAAPFVETDFLLHKVAVSAALAFVTGSEEPIPPHYEEWLSSPVFATGLRAQGAQLDHRVEVLIAGTDSVAKGLVDKMMTHFSTPEYMETADPAFDSLTFLRKCLGASLYHKHCLDAAFLDGPEAAFNDADVIASWQLAIQTTAWLINERRSILGETDEPPSMASTAKWGATLLGANNRLDCILALNPAQRKISDATAKDPAIAAEEEAMTPVSRWKKAFSSVQAMARFRSWRQAMAAGGTSTEGDRRKESELIDSTIQSFVQLKETRFSTDDFKKVLQATKETATQRLTGLNAAADLLQSSVLADDFQSLLLRDLSRAFNSGVLTRTRGAPEELTRALIARRFELLAVLARDLSNLEDHRTGNPEGHISSKLLTIHICNVALSEDPITRELFAQSNVLPTIVELLGRLNGNSHSVQLLRKAAFTLASSLTVQLLQYKPKMVATAEPHAVDFVEHIFDVLAKTLATPAEAESATSHLEPPNDDFLVILLSVLSLAFKVATDDVKAIFAVDTRMARLAACLSTPSHRARMLALRLIASVCPLQRSGTLDITLAGAAVPISSVLFNTLTAALAWQQPGGPDGYTIDGALEVGNSYNEASFTAQECIFALRSLYNVDAWSAPVVAGVDAGLAKVASIQDMLASNPNNFTTEQWGSYWEASAALSVVGGSYNAPRPGTTAEYEETPVAVLTSRGDVTASVYDALNGVRDVNKTDLLPGRKTAVIPPPAHPVNEDTLAGLFAATENLELTSPVISSLFGQFQVRSMALLEQYSRSDPRAVVESVGALLGEVGDLPWVGKAKMQVYCHVNERLHSMQVEETLELHKVPVTATVGNGSFFVSAGIGEIPMRSVGKSGATDVVTGDVYVLQPVPDEAADSAGSANAIVVKLIPMEADPADIVAAYTEAAERNAKAFVIVGFKDTDVVASTARQLEALITDVNRKIPMCLCTMVEGIDVVIEAHSRANARKWVAEGRCAPSTALASARAGGDPDDIAWIFDVSYEQRRSNSGGSMSDAELVNSLNAWSPSELSSPERNAEKFYQMDPEVLSQSSTGQGPTASAVEAYGWANHSFAVAGAAGVGVANAIAEISTVIARHYKQKIICSVLTNWPPEVKFDLAALGDPGALATFVVNYIRDKRPAPFERDVPDDLVKLLDVINSILSGRPTPAAAAAAAEAGEEPAEDEPNAFVKAAREAAAAASTAAAAAGMAARNANVEAEEAARASREAYDAAANPPEGELGDWGAAAVAAAAASHAAQKAYEANGGAEAAAAAAAEAAKVAASAETQEVDLTAWSSLRVSVQRARGLTSKDLNGYSDPFCMVKPVGSNVVLQTSTRFKTLNPNWYASFVIRRDDLEADNEAIEFEVWDEDVGRENDFEGKAVVNVADLAVGIIDERWHTLEARSDDPAETVTGAILIRVQKVGEHSGDTTVAYAEGGEEYTGEDVNLRHTEVSGAAFPELKFATTLLYSTLHGIVSSDLDAGSLFIAANVILNHMGLFGDRIHLLHHAMLKGGLFDRSAAGRIIAMPAVLNMLMRLTSNRMPISKSAMQAYRCMDKHLYDSANDASESLYVQRMAEIVLIYARIANPERLFVKDLSWWGSLGTLDDLLKAFDAESVEAFPDQYVGRMLATTGDSHVIETPHNYENNMDVDYNWTADGAEGMTCTFDPQSTTENTYDYLDVWASTQADRSDTNKVGRYMGGSIPQTIEVNGPNISCHFHSDGSNTQWGIKLTCVANVPPTELGDAAKTEFLAPLVDAGWNLNNDYALVALINAAVEKSTSWKNKSELAAKVTELMGEAAEGAYGFTPLQAETRLPFLILLNRTVEQALPWISLADSSIPSSVVSRFSRLNGLIFASIKGQYLDRVLAETAFTGERPEFNVNRIRAMNRSHDGTQALEDTLLAQMAAYVEDPAIRERLRQTERGFKANFIGEGSIDAGGPYREAVTQTAQELQAEGGLMVVCPNGKGDVGQNRSAFVPRPSYTEPLHIKLYRFAGMMLGIALRTKGAYEVSFPPLIWKALLGHDLDRTDLAGVDVATVRALDSVRDIDKMGVDADAFADLFFDSFTTNLADGSEIELCPGGREIDLTFENRHRYCDLVENAQLTAYETQVDAIRSGLQEVVPVTLLAVLLTAPQLELLVCGKPQVDLELLRSQTEYSGCSESDEHVQFLWQTLESFSPEERSAFLRFVWGRSRLPLTASGFDRRFKIDAFGGGNHDQSLPAAHTCFFTIDLPRYTSFETCRAKVLYAIINCVSVDADSSDVDRSGWA